MKRRKEFNLYLKGERKKKVEKGKERKINVNGKTIRKRGKIVSKSNEFLTINVRYFSIKSSLSVQWITGRILNRISYFNSKKGKS